ncbi:MAG TPA: hypothetical protein VGO11_14175 [Chthoniobacteraceae bacterium]|jgi:hypothetical protein|nr:hypothetical protein [Chthoniobacteraceae bacterium]
MVFPRLIFWLCLLAALPAGIAAPAAPAPPEGLLVYVDAPTTSDIYASAIEYRSIEVFPTVQNLMTAAGPRTVENRLVRYKLTYAGVSPVAFPNIVLDGDLRPVDVALQQVVDLSNRFPVARKFLTPYMTALSQEKERFRLGQAKWGGQWYNTRAQALAARDAPLKMEEAERLKAEAAVKEAADRAKAAEMAKQQLTEEPVKDYLAKAAPVLKSVVAERGWQVLPNDVSRVQPLPETLRNDLEEIAGTGRELAKSRVPAAMQAAFSETSTSLEASLAWSRAAVAFAAQDCPKGAELLRDYLLHAPGEPANNLYWQKVAETNRICQKQEEDAAQHLRFAGEYAQANRTTGAIKEYEAAQKVFPDPRNAREIKRLREDSLGL